MTALKLVHRSGYVACHASGNSNWGCKNSNRINIHITDDSKNRLYPRLFTFDGHGWYNVQGYNSNSGELELTFETPITGSKGKELQIWYGEDLADRSESDNHGTSCAAVYAMFG